MKQLQEIDPSIATITEPRVRNKNLKTVCCSSWSEVTFIERAKQVSHSGGGRNTTSGKICKLEPSKGFSGAWKGLSKGPWQWKLVAIVNTNYDWNSTSKNIFYKTGLFCSTLILIKESIMFYLMSDEPSLVALYTLSGGFRSPVEHLWCSFLQK